MFRKKKFRALPSILGKQPQEKQVSSQVNSTPFVKRRNASNLMIFGMPDDSIDFEFTTYEEGSGS